MCGRQDVVWKVLGWGMILGVALLASGCGGGDDPASPPNTQATGTIVIDPAPDSIDAPWTLTAPDGGTRTGAGDMTLANMAVGTYAITWEAVTGWNTPDEGEATLTEGGTITLSCTYTEEAVTTGSIIVSPIPDTIDAPWTLMGPGGVSQTGTGKQGLVDMPAGSYTVTWGWLENWITPDPPTVTATLDAGQSIALTGTYTPLDDFLLVSGGSFTMGSPDTEPGRWSGETLHTVTLTGDFYLAPYEVTEELWDEIMGSGTSTSQLPRTQVSWSDAIAFCNALSAARGLTPAYVVNGGDVTWNRDANGYRLPTEAEWEYACRAGSTTAFADGDITATDCTLDANLNTMGWYCGNASATVHAVGGKVANTWGLYDMHGNVWEWCWDWFDFYPAGDATDPTGPASGSARVVRGGSFNDTAASCRSANRGSQDPDSGTAYTGLRLVRSAS